MRIILAMPMGTGSLNLCTCAACASSAQVQGCQQLQGLILMSWPILHHLEHCEVTKFQMRSVRLSVVITSRGGAGGLAPSIPGPSLALGCFRRANLVV